MRICSEQGLITFSGHSDCMGGMKREVCFYKNILRDKHMFTNRSYAIRNSKIVDLLKQQLKKKFGPFSKCHQFFFQFNDWNKYDYSKKNPSEF